MVSFSRVLQGMEQYRPPLFLEVATIQEGLHRLAQVAVFARQLRIATSPELLALYRAKAKLHPDLLWQLCDIQSYNPELVELHTGCSWLPEELGWDGTNNWDEEEVEEMALEL